MQARQQVTGVPPRFISKPIGGFRPISIVQVGMAWWAYKSGILPRYLDFRVYLAFHEFDERRLAAARTRAKVGKGMLKPVLSIPNLVAELRKLTGGSNERLVRESLRRLASLGLITVTPTAVLFAEKLECLTANMRTELGGLIQNRPHRAGIRDRRLPLPRRVLRYLARGAPASVAATVFGYVIRCVWWRGRGCEVAGSCTAEFISDLFGVESRSVKRARAELRVVGWLVNPQPSDESPGGSCLPNLSWSRAGVVYGRNARQQSCTVLSLPPPDRRTDLSPPSICTQLRSGSKHQQPHRRRLSGIRGGNAGISRPRLSSIQPADLSSTERLNVLFEEATSSGVVQRTPADRLRFFAAAARASRLGSRNPCGFFSAVVRRGLWHVISQADEDLAIERLKADRATGLSPHVAPSQRFASTPNPMQHGRKVPTGVAEVQALVASLAVHCSMEKSPQVSRKCQHDQSPACAPAARVPIGPRSKGPSEASGRGAIGWDAARACGRAPGGLSLNDGVGPVSDDLVRGALSIG